MKTKVKEIQVKVNNPDTAYSPFHATVRDGEIASVDMIGTSCPDTQRVEAYITFLKEVLEAIEETKERSK